MAQLTSHNGYAIVYASLLVFFGRLDDRCRRDRGFLLGVSVFTAASAPCAASTTVGMLVAFPPGSGRRGGAAHANSLGPVPASYIGMAQGFLFARPLVPEDVDRLLAVSAPGALLTPT